MVFGLPNPFGGSNNDKDKSSSSSSSPFQPDDSSSSQPPSNSTSQPIFSSALGGVGGSSATSSAEIKTRIQGAVAEQVNVHNAKLLMSKINENCFDHCVPSPGTSLSSKEQSCLSACMEKYIDGWNVVSRTYVSRLQREGANVNTGAAGQGGVF